MVEYGVILIVDHSVFKSQYYSFDEFRALYRVRYGERVTKCRLKYLIAT